MTHSLRLILVTTIAALAGLLFGYDTGVISGANLYYTKFFDLNSAQEGWATSSALVGCFFGAICAGLLTRQIGRKLSLILSGVLFVISAWGSGATTSLDMLVVYRIIGGLGIGIASMSAPMYISEISPPHIRGRLVSLYQLAIVIGFFVVFLATYYIGGGDTAHMSAQQLAARASYNLEAGWRLMFWSELLPASVFFLLLFFVPRSPRWLMIKGRQEAALAVLRTITGSEEEALQEREAISASLSSTGQAGFGAIFSKGLGLALLIGVMLSIFQQITGINAILYYGAEIFANALGYGPDDALKQQLWLAGVNLAFTFVAIFTVDLWGRKPLLIVGNIGMFIGLGVLGYTIYTGQLGIVSLIAVLTFIASFAMSMGPVVWVMLSEIYPNRVRSAALAVAVAAQWLFNGIVTGTYPVVRDSQLNTGQFNGALPYFIFAFFCIMTVLFVWRLVPETKGKTLEQMEALWKT